MSEAKRILFTGQAGLNVKGILEKLGNHISGNETFRCLNLEDCMKTIYLDDWPEDRPNYDMVKEPGGCQALLALPESYLRLLWGRAATDMSDRLSNGENAFISLHGAFYHPYHKGFFPCVQGEQLRGLKISRVVNLIDDIWDIWARLSQPDQLFNTAGLEFESGFYASMNSILNLMSLLDWRLVEMFASEQIANQLGLGHDHILLPIKHNLEVAKELLFQGREPAYISHPIAEPRRLRREGKENEADAIEREVQSLTERLLTQSNFVSLAPTAIDELRIALNETGDYLPKLEKRWEYGDHRNLLFSPIVGDGSEALDPQGWFSSETPEAEVFSISLLLSTLGEKIKAHINSRDHRLVAQSSAIVVWRPYFNGSISKGVLEEVGYRNDLAEYEERSIPCYVYSPRSDLARHRVSTIVTELKEAGVAKEKAESFRSAMEQDTELMEQIREDRLDVTVVQALAQENDVVIPYLPDKSALSPEPGPKARVDSRKKWKEIVASANSEDRLKEFKTGIDVWCEDDDISPEEFVRNVVPSSG